MFISLPILVLAILVLDYRQSSQKFIEENSDYEKWKAQYQTKDND